MRDFSSKTVGRNVESCTCLMSLTYLLEADSKKMKSVEVAIDEPPKLKAVRGHCGWRETVGAKSV